MAKETEKRLEKEGDPSKLEIIRSNPTLGPDGRLRQGDGFMALGEEEDVLAMLRAMGWSEEAIAAFKSGEPIVCTTERTIFGNDVVVAGTEDWLSKMEREGRKTIGGGKPGDEDKLTD